MSILFFYFYIIILLTIYPHYPQVIHILLTIYPQVKCSPIPAMLSDTIPTVSIQFYSNQYTFTNSSHILEPGPVLYQFPYITILSIIILYILCLYPECILYLYPANYAYIASILLYYCIASQLLYCLYNYYYISNITYAGYVYKFLVSF